jgi:hypothetical protein
MIALLRSLRRTHPLPRTVLTVSKSDVQLFRAEHERYLDTVRTVRGSGWVRRRLS